MSDLAPKQGMGITCPRKTGSWSPQLFIAVLVVVLGLVAAVGLVRITKQIK